MDIQQVVREVTIRGTAPGVDDATRSVGRLSDAQDRLAVASGKVTRSQESVDRALDKLQRQSEDTYRQQQMYLDTQKQLAAANDNVSRSFQAANDDTRAATDSWRSSVVDIADMTNHLKLAALALYAYSPAVRAAVNPALTESVKTLGPAAISAGGAIISAFSPALSFLARISAPIVAVAVAWKGLNGLVNEGAGLLNKYSNAGRALESPTLAANLKALTALQSDDNILPQQAQSATELATRLSDAKFRISEFLKVQFDTTDAALALQRIWTNIVEKIAAATDVARRLSTINGANYGAPVDEPNPGYNYGSEQPKSAEAAEIERKALLKKAQDNISAQLGIRAGRTGNPNANLGNTFEARYTSNIEALSKMFDKDPASDVKALTGEFDRLYLSMQRQAASQEADTQAVGKSVGEHARLRDEFRLLEAAQQDIAKNGGNISDYTARIKTMADRMGEAAQKAAELRAQDDAAFRLQTVFLSDIDAQIAQVQRSLHGNGWPQFMNDGLAATMRITDALKQTRDLTTSFATDFAHEFKSQLQQGASQWDAFRAAGAKALDSLADKLMDMAIKNLVGQAFGGSSGGFNLFSLFGFGGGNWGAAGAGGLGSAVNSPLGLAGSAGALYDTGGYTGNYGRHQVAGLVHGQEFVVNADATARHLPMLTAMNDNRMPGFEAGGYAGSPAQVSVFTPAQMRSLGPAGGEGDVHVTYAPVYNVKGSGPEINQLLAQRDRDKAEEPSRILKIVREARSRRVL